MTEYSVEYAKSGRAGCKVCKAKIDMGLVRIGTSVPGDGDYMMTSWRHLECQKKPKTMVDLTELIGLTALQPEDQAKVQTWWDAASALPAKSTGKKRAAPGDDGGGGSGIDAASLVPKKMKVGELKDALAAHGLPTTGKKAEHVKALEEVVHRAKLEAEFSALSVAKLKQVLEHNVQIKSGDKQELINRCVDGKMFGALPRCPLCGGGILKVAYAVRYGHGGQGRFSCPGYYDGDAFVRCGLPGDTQAARIPWQDLA